MNGNELERKLKKLGKKNGIVVKFYKAHGKGSHGTICYGDKCTTLKDKKKEIGMGLLKAMLSQLGIDEADI